MKARALLFPLLLASCSATAFFAGATCHEARGAGSKLPTPAAETPSEQAHDLHRDERDSEVTLPARAPLEEDPRKVQEEAGQVAHGALERLEGQVETLRTELKRVSDERDLLRMQCENQLAVQFFEEYSGKLEKEDINLVASYVVDALETIPSNDQITQFLSGHKEHMRNRQEVDKRWFAIKGDPKHPDAAEIAEQRKSVGESWRFELERIFGIEGARRIAERP